MNIDELRTALHEPGPPLAVDLDRVVSRGRRRRAVRRAAVPVTMLATAAAVAVPIVLAGGNGGGKVETAAPPKTTAPATRSAVPTAPRPTPTAIAGAIPAAAFGDVIGTGEQVAGMERVFSFYPVEPDARFRARFRLGLGYRAAGGRARSVGGANEIRGLDDAAGFHATTATGAGMVLPRGDWAVFGYYAGPATRITAVVDGRTVTAKTAQWPGYPRIVVFWLSPGTGSPKPRADTAVTGLHAYDAGGRTLPAGPHTEVSAG